MSTSPPPVSWRPAELDTVNSEFGAWTITPIGRIFQLHGPHDTRPSFLAHDDLEVAKQFAAILVASYRERAAGIRRRPRPYRRRRCPTC